jgi:hypothetical protein
MFYTMRFIDGLCADIKVTMLVLCPKDLDTACTVVMLQPCGGSRCSVCATEVPY